MVTNIYTASSIGDIIVFDSKISLTKNEFLTFSDTVTGTTSNSFFTKHFRYALDGVHFTDWINLTQQNLNILSTLLTEDVQLIWLQFQYTYSGTVSDVPLTITAVTINSTSIRKDYNYNLTSQTIFGVYVNDPRVYDLMNNLSAKLFDLGIVPTYVNRGEEYFALNVDEDYIDFWTSVAHYYALYFVYCLQFTDIFNQQNLLCEFLKEKNLFFCGCSDLQTLQLLAKNYYSEIRSRGTFEIFRKKGYQYPIGIRMYNSIPDGYLISESGVSIDGIVYYDIDLLNSLPDGWVNNAEYNVLYAPEMNYHQVLYFNEVTGKYDIPPITRVSSTPTEASGIYKQYDGEYLRLICFDSDCDEFFYVNLPLQYCGWNLNNSSPMYRGYRPIYTDGFIKGYENTFDFKDLLNYPVIGSPSIASQSINYLDKTFPNAQTLTLTTGQGLGFVDGTTTVDKKYLLNVSPSVDYEISFWFKQDTTNPSLELSALSFDCSGDTQQPLFDIKTGNTALYFIKTTDKIISKSGTWYFARYCLYRSSQPSVIGSQPKTSLGAGTNLILNDTSRKIMIGLNCTSGNVDIWNFKIKPLKADFSFCFLDSISFLFLYLKNNNNNLSSSLIKQISSRYLLPYNMPQSKIVLLD